MTVEHKLISDNLEEISQAKIMARLAGRSYLDPDDPERKKKRPTGFNKKDPVFVSVENAQAWVYYGAGKIVVACRGTEPSQFADILADLKTIPVSRDLTGVIKDDLNRDMSWFQVLRRPLRRPLHAFFSL